MTSFFHDLEEQIRTAAHQRVSGPETRADSAPPPAPDRGRRWGWLIGSARAVPVLAAVAVTIVVLVGALVLLGHRGGQAPTPPAAGGPGNTFAAIIEHTPKAQLRRELALMSSATRKIQASAVCRVTEPRTAPVIHGRPGAALLSTLGVLRRPAQPADRLPRAAFSQPGPGIAVYAGAARRAARILGTSYYLVPIRQNPAGAVPSARCFSLQSQALAKALPTFPARLRSPIHKLAAAFIAYDASLAAKPPVDAVCEVTVQRNGGGMDCSDTAEEIRHNVFPSNDNGVFTGLVPDGVAAVTLTFPAAPGRAARSVTTAVHGNVYAVKTGISEPPTPGSPTITWRAADGHVVRTYTQPSPAQLRKLCRQHHGACVSAVALVGAGGVSASSSSASATVPSQPSPHSTTTGG